jgi:predicted nucleic acid-binding protein
VRRVTLDSNVLVYAALEPQSEKGRAATRLIEEAAARGVLAAQALGEFVNVIRRRAPDLLGHAIDQIEALTATYVVAPTDGHVIHAAGTFARRHRLQFWDAVIWMAARAAGARIFLSEDLQDGLAIEGMRVLNPFAAPNQAAIAEILNGSVA